MTTPTQRQVQQVHAKETAIRKLIAATHRRGIALAKLARALANLNAHRRADLAKLEASIAPAGGVVSPKVRLGGADWYSGDGQVDLAAYAASGRYDIAIRKATEALGYIDPGFSSDWAKIRRHGNLHRAAYHFFHGTNPIGEARHFVATVKAAGLLPTDILVCDAEINDAAQLDGQVDAWFAEVHRLCPRNELWLYSAEQWRQWQARGGRRCWVAALNGRRSVGSLLGLQGTVVLHQFTFTASIAGGHGQYDLSVVP